ncbi:MAG: 30S ribosomal protein S6 [Verrucomicrobiota bacterium]
MKRNYQALIVLDLKGKEESVDTLISNIGKDFEKAGAKLEQIDQLGKRTFPYSPRHVTSGFFVKYHVSAESSVLDAVRGKLKLNESVYQQYYQRA